MYHHGCGFLRVAILFRNSVLVPVSLTQSLRLCLLMASFICFAVWDVLMFGAFFLVLVIILVAARVEGCYIQAEQNYVRSEKILGHSIQVLSATF